MSDGSAMRGGEDEARLQDLQGIGRHDWLSEFPRSQALAPHMQTCCFPITSLRNSS